VSVEVGSRQIEAGLRRCGRESRIKWQSGKGGGEEMELSQAFFGAFAVLVWGAAGLYLMLPRGQAAGRRGGRYLGALLLLVSLGLLAKFPVATASGVRQTAFLWGFQDIPLAVCFWAMAALSLASAVLMVTSRNPIYSALWFAVVLLANSGIYLINDASFLSAATVIVYAGAIVVTFLFVVMLAQPEGTAPYDRLTREPFLASCVAGLALAVTLLSTLYFSANTEVGQSPVAGARSARPAVATVAAAVDKTKLPTKINAKAAHTEGLGRSLFLEHYLSVEVIGVLLLAAVVGAMQIATHRVEPASDGAVAA
jgi:NADH-quinone oxidoreductase subunit J